MTRGRDLVVVAVIGAVIGYLLLRWSYQRLPQFPRLAGLPAAVIGLGEIAFGLGLRRRIAATGPERRAVDGLAVARAVAIAKATSLAGAAFGGLWIGVLGYVIPSADQVTAAAADRATGLFGLGCAAVMVAGGLFLERCCRTPEDPRPPDESRYPHAP